jgi:hypothetical protein
MPATFQTVAINGGLDLITAPQSVPPGRLLDCYNYEVARQRGIRRMDGYERADGGASPSSARFVEMVLVSYSMSAGTQFCVYDTTLDSGIIFYVMMAVANDGLGSTSWAFFTGVDSNGNRREPPTIDALNSGNWELTPFPVAGNLSQVVSAVSVPTIAISNTDDLAAREAYFNLVSPTIQEVPGQGNVNGVFWLKDKLYATRDYFAIDFTTGSVQPNPGDTLYIGASFGAATWAGQVAKIVLTSGSWLDSASSANTGNAAGQLMVYNTTGTYSNATINNHTQGDVAALVGTGNDNVSLGAGLYLATGQRGNTTPTQSWQWCDLGYMVQYKNGVVDFVNMNVTSTASALAAQYVTTGWKTATTPAGGNAGWSVSGGGYPGALSTNDAANYVEHVYTTGGNSYPIAGVLQLTGFGFTDADIPSTAAITGIEVQMQRGAIGVTAGHTASIVDKTLTLVGVAAYPVPVNFGDTVNAWAVTDGGTYPSYVFTLKDYGAPTTATAPTDLLGYNGITAADVKSANFGINFTIQLLGTQTLQQLRAGITQVRMRVSFLPETNKIYFWNGKSTSVADGAITVNTKTLTSATAAFTAASVGQTVTVAGAGTAGGLLTATITAYTNSTTVTLSIAAGTTVSGATTTFYQPVVAHVVQFYKQSGSNASSNAAGTVYLQFVQPDGTVGGPPSRAIGAGEAIRTFPSSAQAPDGGAADGTTHLSDTSSGATLNVMDWGALLAGATQSDGSIAPPSKYQSITKNFYASTGYDAIFGVSGGGPGFYYDGVKVNASNVSVPGNFSRILTGYAADKDKPRSVEAHQNHLMYGYLAGTVQQSDSANVLVFDPTLGNRDATEYGFSDRVTGIRSINGDSMAVWTQSTVQMIQGQVDAGNAYASTIAPTSGGIEYSIQPMANFMYADFRGITMIGATQKYGDFEVGHVSSEVSPFLLPRLQLSSLLESGAIGFLNSVLIRSKNMERKFFADGYCMSMTFLVDGENPQFSIQQYLKSDGVTPAPWSVVQAFTESSGRDRIFGAIADGTGFVYELERGNTFDGLAIPHYAVLVPDTGQTAYQNKQFSGINIYGQAQDYATFQLSRNNNYQDVVQATGGNVISQTFGSASPAPTGKVKPFVSYGTSALQLEGTAIGLRFDGGTNGDPSSSVPQFSHTIQALSYTVSPLNQKAS